MTSGRSKRTYVLSGFIAYVSVDEKWKPQRASNGDIIGFMDGDTVMSPLLGFEVADGKTDEISNVVSDGQLRKLGVEVLEYGDHWWEEDEDEEGDGRESG